MIPAKYAPILFGFILSGLMTSIVSAIATVRVLDGETTFLSIWFGTWIFSWAVGFPIVLFVAPMTRRLVAKLTRP